MSAIQCSYLLAATGWFALGVCASCMGCALLEIPDSKPGSRYHSDLGVLLAVAGAPLSAVILGALFAAWINFRVPKGITTAISPYFFVMPLACGLAHPLIWTAIHQLAFFVIGDSAFHAELLVSLGSFFLLPVPFAELCIRFHRVPAK
ncbi:hypothetical protein [Lignipirellula cremea]|uniref:hypothetical protein n=1 Tax=Lignipirellula cremea TaxID=2528010 RepID=UPI00119E2496|nr:hypothetical protein [Lignipirellula cremea]